MSYVFYIVIFSLLCIVANSNDCKRLKDGKVTGITEEYIQQLVEDANNITKHKDAYIANLRKIIKTNHLPVGVVKYYFIPSVNESIALNASKCSFKNIPYDNKKPLAFGIHGFGRQIYLDRGIMGDLVQATVKLNKYNAIFVDYSDLTDDVFSVVVPRAFLAAKEMAQFLRFLMDETGTKPEQIHIIGISLGGQMSGYIGHLIPGVGRITGLDPGGLFFYDFPMDLMLDRTDGDFVDVIHTGDAHPFPKGYGFYPPSGHLDFYPNGGKFQPGCGSTIPIEQTPTTAKENEARICMHDRMMIYYTESMCDNCYFIGTSCKSYENFEKGLCTASNSKTAIMGEFATKPIKDLPEETMFFLDTNDHYPFCKHQQSEKNC